MSETAPPAPGGTVGAADQTAAPSAVTKASSYRAELKKWHENAALSDVQERCLAELQARRHVLAARPLPAHLQDAGGEEAD